MTEIHSRIFRADALRRHAQNGDATVLPRFVSPPAFVCLWILIALLGAGASAAWFLRVPVYVTGHATLVTAPNGEVVVAGFFQPEDLSRLRSGQRLFLYSGSSGERWTGSILEVKQEITSPEAARHLFAMGAGAADALRAPSAVVIASFETRAGMPARTYLGSSYRAEIEIGSRRVISLLPIIGSLLGAI